MPITTSNPCVWPLTVVQASNRHSRAPGSAGRRPARALVRIGRRRPAGQVPVDRHRRADAVGRAGLRGGRVPPDRGQDRERQLVRAAAAQRRDVEPVGELTEADRQRHLAGDQHAAELVVAARDDAVQPGPARQLVAQRRQQQRMRLTSSQRVAEQQRAPVAAVDLQAEPVGDHVGERVRLGEQALDPRRRTSAWRRRRSAPADRPRTRRRTHARSSPARGRGGAWAPTALRASLQSVRPTGGSGNRDAGSAVISAPCLAARARPPGARVVVRLSVVGSPVARCMELGYPN